MTRTTKIRPLSFAVVSFALLGLMTTPLAINSMPQAYADGTLFIGSDVEEFSGAAFGSPLDKIGVYTTTGGVAVGANIALAQFDVANGMTVLGFNQLLTGTVGTPFTINVADGSTIKIRDFATTPGASFVAAIPSFSFNEDYAYDGTSVWQVHCGTGLVTELDPNNLGGGALSSSPAGHGCPVGATVVNGVLWISNWDGRTFGTFDPTTDTYTPMINTNTNAGCLAYDAHSGILWGGQSGGLVIPYDITTLQPINAGFLPFGTMLFTIDGCAFFTPAFNGEKTWTHTDYNWDPICDNPLATPTDGRCILSDGSDIGPTRPANINNNGENSDPDDDVLADPLPITTTVGGVDKYTLFAQMHKKGLSNTNPGAFYALTTINIVDQFGELDGLTVWEKYGDCFEDEGFIKFVSKNPTRNVKIAVAAPNGDITELTERLYDESDSGVKFEDNEDPTSESAHVEINDTSLLTAGSTVYVLVKFKNDLKGADPNQDGVFDVMCDNTEMVDGIFDGADDESETFEAALRITNDFDSDGVPSPADQCPDTDPGVIVDADGCEDND